jgi:phospholipid/cholesterol/gamma-HCH transport system substrate-binding protein
VGIVESLERKVGSTLDRWESVGERVDRLLAKHEGDVDQVLSELAVSLRSFNQTMKSANAMLGDPQNQQNVRRTLEEMPKLLSDTREAVSAVRGATALAEKNLANLQEVTAALANRTGSFVVRLDQGAAKANQLLDELQLYARRFNQEDGSLAQLMGNPDLYNNLNNAAFHLNELLTRLQPVVANLEIFSDTVARFPEKLGIGGVVSPSKGTKPGSNAQRRRPLRQAEATSRPSRGGL